MAEQEAFIGSVTEVTPTDERAVEPVVGDIRKDWDSVGPAVNRLIQDYPQLSFRSEDVYAAVVSGEAIYWKAPEGFVISTVEIDEFSGEKTLLIWLAWSHKRGKKNVLKYYPFFQKTAKEAGMEAIEVRTPLPEMRQILVGAGWKVDTVVYRLEV
jgi:hypothetical protein